jgi:hypothetical protein
MLRWPRTSSLKERRERFDGGRDRRRRREVGGDQHGARRGVVDELLHVVELDLAEQALAGVDDVDRVVARRVEHVEHVLERRPLADLRGIAAHHVAHEVRVDRELLESMVDPCPRARSRAV